MSVDEPWRAAAQTELQLRLETPSQPGTGGAFGDSLDQAHPTARFAGWGLFLLHRLLDVVIVLLVAATLAFFAIHLLPGDPVSQLLAGIPEVTEQMRRQVAASYGLDQPVWLQYLTFLGSLAVGNLGISYQLQAPVLEVILSELGPTVELTVSAVIVALALAVLGVLLSSTGGRARRQGLGFVQLVALSIPSFWIGILLISAFSFALPLFPAFGAQDWNSLVLPTLALAIPLAGLLGQVLQERVDSTLAEPFVITVRSRGVREWELRSRHLLRHAASPVLTLSGMIFGSLLGGAVIIENLFGRPGLGRITLQAVQGRDIPLVVGIVVFAALVFAVINIVTDVLYRLLDPRIDSHGAHG